MSTYIPNARTNGTQMRLRNSSLTAVRKTTNGRAGNQVKSRVSGWIARSIMLATSAFAILDLLLLSGVHH